MAPSPSWISMVEEAAEKRAAVQEELIARSRYLGLLL